MEALFINYNGTVFSYSRLLLINVFFPRCTFFSFKQDRLSYTLPHLLTQDVFPFYPLLLRSALALTQSLLFLLYPLFAAKHNFW